MELERILDTLYSCYREKQPDRMQYVFPPPTAAEDITAAEIALGMPLPDELRALYARHAYMMNAWGGVSIDPVQSIAESRQSLEDAAFNMAADAARDVDADPNPALTARGPVAPVIYVRSRIPFGSQDGGNTTLLIDPQPPAGGTPGQIVRLDIEFGTIEVVANSLTEFFAEGVEAFTKEGAGAPIEPGRLQQLMPLLGIPIALVMSVGAMLLAIAVIAWSAAPIVAESITGLIRGKRE